MFGQTLPAILIVLVLAMWPLALPPERRGRIWLREGLIWFALAAGFVALFVIGETLSDPGGVQGFILVSAWVLPALVLSWLAYARPDDAAITLTSVCAITVAFNIWAIAAGEWWWRWENQHGPISSIATFACTVPLGVLALHKARIAGWLLIATAVLPELMVFARNPRPGALSLGFLTTPGLVAGILFVLASHAQRKYPRGFTQPQTGEPPQDYPGIPGSTGKAA